MKCKCYIFNFGTNTCHQTHVFFLAIHMLCLVNREIFADNLLISQYLRCLVKLQTLKVVKIIISIIHVSPQLAITSNNINGKLTKS